MKNQPTATSKQQLMSFEDFCKRLPPNEYWSAESKKRAFQCYIKDPENYFKS